MGPSHRNLFWPLGLLLVCATGCGPRGPVSPSESYPPEAAPTNTLAHRWIPGKRLQFRYEVSQDLTVTTPELQIKNYVRLAQDYSIETISVTPDEGASVRLQLGKLQVSMKERENSGAFDSQSSREPETEIDKLLQQGFHRLSDISISITLDSTSEITAIQGLDSALKDATQGLQFNLQNIIGSLYDESLVQQLIRFTQLPSGPIQQGQAWPLQGTQRFGLLGYTALDGTASLMGEALREGKPTYQIRFSGIVKHIPQSDDDAKGLFKLISSQFEGRALFDPQLGQFVDGITSYELTVEPRSETVLEKYDILHKHSAKLLSVHDPNGE